MLDLDPKSMRSRNLDYGLGQACTVTLSKEHNIGRPSRWTVPLNARHLNICVHTCITKWLVSENKEPVASGAQHVESAVGSRYRAPFRSLKQDGFITIFNNLTVSTHLQYNTLNAVNYKI